ncbi:PaaI family thioesterase [Caldimonas brevitalea]|uniref:Phenylacetic acid degradation protein n=1 Tax=Caldimonas brevitalea TaxID=413882 RepID=A0A0G3BCX6_9BURK|nr:PaaI family thioesterase [Caldimonas brevitalea]AKJ27192.1 phenylacetic acid degradation protein [Caldimonas brevitalea]
MSDRSGFFWQIQNGEVPTPEAVKTLCGRVVSVDPEAGTIETEFRAGLPFTNPAGKIQGGFLAAMLDDTMGPALAATLKAGEFAPTLSLNVNYLQPASVGLIRGVGRVVRRGGKVCHLSGELYQGENLVASGTAVALLRSS